MLEWVLCVRPNFKSVCLFALFLLFTEYYRFSQFDKDEITLLVSVMECLRTCGSKPVPLYHFLWSSHLTVYKFYLVNDP